MGNQGPIDLSPNQSPKWKVQVCDTPTLLSKKLPYHTFFTTDLQ